MSDIDAFLDGPGVAGPESQIDSFLGKPESSGVGRRLAGDTGVSLMKGLASVPEIVVGIADIPTFGRVGSIVEDAGLDFESTQNYWSDLYSPEQKAANQRVSDADGFVDTAGAMLENPSTIAHGVVEALPPMLAGGVVARGLGAVSKLPAFARGAIGEGIVSAGLSAEGIRQQTDDGLLTPGQSAAAAAIGAGTGLIGAGGAKVAQRLGIGEIDTLLAGGARQQGSKGVARSAAEGAAVEGLLQELPQSMQEQALQNIALGRPWDEGVGSAGAAGMLTGTALGGVVGPLGRGPQIQQPPQQPPQQEPAGPIGRVAQMLPAPERLALPAPEPVFVADAQGNVSEQGQIRDVDREQRPVPGRTPGNGGPGMDQQTSRGVLPLSGELIPAPPSQQRKAAPESRTFDAEPVRLGLPDLRPEAVIVDSEGRASIERTATPAPAKSRVDGMEAQAQPGQKPKFEQVLQRARTVGAQADAAALAAETGATRAQAARAIRGAQAEQQVTSAVYKSVPGANKAMRELPQPDAFEVIKSGNREWRIQPRQEVPSVDSRAGAVDVGAASNLPVTPGRADNVAGVPVVAERAPAAVPAAEQSGSDIPAAVEKPDGQRSLKTEKPAAEKNAKQAERDALPDILGTPRKRYIERQAKAAGIKKGSPGYAQAVSRIEAQYEGQVDDAQAALPFEQYNALNKESPEGVNRQAWTQLRKERGIETVAAPKAKPIAGKDIDGDWSMFSEDSGSLNIPRADMPQIKAEHRGAMVNFLNARDIAHQEETIAADKLKPTQAEYSSKKVEKAKAFEGGDRSILISKDGHVLDGHHQWLAKRDAGEDVKVIRLDAPIKKLLAEVAEFPSATQDAAGSAAMYSRGSYRRGPTDGKGSRAVQLRMQLKRLTGGWQNAPDIKVVQSIKDLPDAQRRQVEREGAFDVEGMFADGAVYLVADNLRDVKHAAFVLQHEVLGHAGLQGAYGFRLKPLLMSLYNSNADLKAQAETLVQRFGYEPAVAMEEVLADMAADGSIQQQAFWPRLVAAMRAALRSIGVNIQWSDGDIQLLLGNARRYIKNGRRPSRGRSVYSRNGSSGRLVEMLDDKGRLLAPNGKPSRLNQKQWHQARSDNFKRWFGDWQGLNTQQRLDAVKPLKLRMPDAWKGLSEKERLAKVEESLKGMARLSEALPHDELGEVAMGMSGAKKAASSAADPAKQAILARLQNAFEHSIYASSSLDQNAPTTTAYHKLLAPIDVDGVPLVAVFTVREDANGRMFYNTVAVDRKEEAPAVSPGDMNDNAQRSTPANARAPGNFVRRPLQRVNPNSVSKVTDGNGEPLVLYHGTAEEFNVFDQTRAGRSTGHTTAPLGIFLDQSRSLTKGYAEKAADGMPGLANVMPLFASIKNPYRMTVAESLEVDTFDKAVSLRSKLEREGYDGIQLVSTGTWVAFYNNQVKSATNNTGAFDQVDPDIRYSRAGYARDLFDRATGSTPLERDDPFAAENRRLREGEKTLWQKAKKEFARQFAPGGLLPTAVFNEKITRDSEFQTVEFDVRHLSSGLNKAVKAGYGVDLDSLSAEQMKPLAEALAGKVDPSIPEATRVAIIAMRQYIDSLSGEYLSIIQGQIDAHQEKSATYGPALKAANDARKALNAAINTSSDPAITRAAAAKKAALAAQVKAKKAMDGLKGDQRAAAKAAYDAAVKVHDKARSDLRAVLSPELKAQLKEADALRDAANDARSSTAEAKAEAALYEKIAGNLGAYVNRSYQAFDDPKWFKTVPTEVVNAARVYLAKGYIEQGETAAEAARLADVTVNEMLKNGTAYDSMGGFIAESKLGAKDLTVLIKRKEIAPEIRALLGEYMDPRLNFAKSATKMGRMVWNQRFLDRVLEFGMGTLFFEGKNRPADATTQIAGEQSESYAPLNGLWTFPEVAQAFQDALGKEQMSDLYRTVVQLNGMVKYGKTILSPTTAMRNWQSAMFFSLANGHFDLTQMKKSWAALREQVTQNATGEDLAYLRKLKQLGVVYDTPYAGEMMALMQDARMDELLSSKSGTGLKWLRKANQFAQGFYSFGDDFWKIIGFENEKASLVAAGIPVAEAETMAAERIRNTYPTYSMIGKAVQWLRRFPLAGTFVSFPSEIIRTTVGMMKLVNADLKSDNPKIRAIGRKRAAGMAMVSAGFYALSAMTAAALGVDDDEEEALRDLAAPWSKNSTFLYTGRDADGKLRYFDMSFLDPYGYWKRPLTAMMRDQPWQDAAASGISDMLSPFFGADITAGAIFEVLANKKPTGGQVYNENAGSVDQLQDIANHMRKALQPGFVSNAERLWLAGSEARREGSGQPYAMRDEVVSLLGWRAATLDTQTGLYYRSFDFNDALSDARKTLTRTLRSSNEVSPDDIRESKEAASAQYQKAFTEMSRLVNSAGLAGMSRSQIVQTLKLSGVAQRNIFALLSGNVPPMEIGMQAQAKAVQQARVMRDSEHAAEIARRFRLAREQ